MAWFPSAPVPPSETRDGEPHKLRFLGQEEPDKPVQKGYGNLYVLAILAAISLIFMFGALYLGLQAQGEVHVSVSNVSAQLGTCLTHENVIGSTQPVTFTFTLTNSGSHDAVVVADLYANGELLGSAAGVAVPAGSSVPVVTTVTQWTCGPVIPSVVLSQVSPAG